MPDRVLLNVTGALYERAARPVIFRTSAQHAHERVLDVLRRADDHEAALNLLGWLHRSAFESQRVSVGGVALEHPLILAAGLVKGHGFETESAALEAVTRGENIIPGWRALPRLVGGVEFGSFTRWPRLGNPGVVVWRDVPTHSTQNRVGLKNPGARAAAAFLGKHQGDLPPVYGINIAVSPGVDSADEEQREMLEAIDYFLQAGLRPSWLTMNLSCPNTEDDPGARQTAEHARSLCKAVTNHLPVELPLWVKLSPGLADEQYQALMAVLAREGVRAVIATNTLPLPAPDGSGLAAGAAGGRLHGAAVAAAAALLHAKAEHGYPVDVIGCGGIEDAATLHDFACLGVHAFQYWTALIYRGPLAAALIMNEVKHA